MHNKMNSLLSCLVCFSGCIYVQNTILNKCSLFPWPAHTFAEHYGQARAGNGLKRLFIPDNTKNSRLCKTNILQYTKMKCSSTLQLKINIFINKYSHINSLVFLCQIPFAKLRGENERCPSKVLAPVVPSRAHNTSKVYNLV